MTRIPKQRGQISGGGNALKRVVKNLCQRLLISKCPPIIVASMGRSGSTLIFDAIRHSRARSWCEPLSRFKARVFSDDAWDLEKKEFRNGVVYKTHCLAYELPAGSNARVIFLFGPASDSALSVLSCRDKYGEDWIQEHLQHLRANGKFEDIGEKDVLRFADQLDSWMGYHDSKRLILHYDAIWDHQKLISEFCGFPVNLPARRPRSGVTKADEATRKKFKATYSELDQRIESLPRCKILD
jgi:hypothetical protein